MATTPLAFTVTVDEQCHLCGGAENVLRSSVKTFPPTCVICLFRLIDVPMNWKLSNTAIQTVAHRRHSQEISDEQDKMEAALPPELRRKKRA